MRLIPFERITVESRRSAEELVAALAQVTLPARPIGSRLIRPKETAALVGQVSRDGLRLHRASGYRNSFAPILVGKIVPAPLGARIEGVLQLDPAVLVFMMIWLGITGSAALVGLAQFLRDGTFGELGWIPLAMLAGLYAACVLGFAAEAGKTKQLLRDVAAARQAPSSRG
jgi:hypothetical protein